ncbi:MAG: contractile injection system tape measure protein [Ferruginibacter sp.]
MLGNRHIVQKISLELQLRHAQNALSLQQQCAGLIKNDLVKSMDNFLDTSFPAGEIYRIPKIEIELGDITAADIEKNFVAKCMEAFIKTLKQNGRIEQPVQPLGEIKKIDRDEYLIGQLFYFMSEGRIEYSSTAVDFEEWEQQILQSIKNKIGIFQQRLAQLIMKEAGSLDRLLLQFDDNFISELVAILDPGVKTAFEKLLALIKKEMSFTEALHLKTKLFSLIVMQQEYKTGINPGTSFSPQYQHDEIRQLLNKVRHKGIIKEMLIAVADQIGITTSMQGNDEQYYKEKPAINAEEVLLRASTKEPAVNEENSSMFIDNAGVILLHPFLEAFFTAAGLMDKGNFTDNGSRERAVHLLQFLVLGRQQMPEYMLQLNKILCGVNAEMHINRFTELNEQEIKEALVLLEAVIEHWPALKNTSAAALQETFLQRRAKLSFNSTDKYWKLQVEKKAVDILLNKLPWGYAYIKLPWMEYPLITDWE